MRICKKCILPDTFKNIKFNEEGVCSYCIKETTVARTRNVTDEEKSRLAVNMDELIETHRGKQQYDCAVGFSGGKDSTYLLWILKEKYKLNVLAITFDHSFMPDVTLKNLNDIPKKLAIDILNYQINTSFMEKFFKYKFENYTKKTKEVFDNVCADCSNILEGNVMRLFPGWD